ncbi:MAG: DUF3467 domain-containing protein [Bryobacterales bacterium]|nr:DUF3467 domain-containing protein [Bryobacterales bacterium]
MTTDNPTPQERDPSEPKHRDVGVEIPFPTSYIYSNCASLSISLLDFRIGFAEAMPNGQVEARVGVVMPPEHAAILAMNLVRHLAVYEQQFGEVRDPTWQAKKAALVKTKGAIETTPNDPPKGR